MQWAKNRSARPDQRQVGVLSSAGLKQHRQYATLQAMISSVPSTTMGAVARGLAGDVAALYVLFVARLGTAVGASSLWRR